VEHTRPEALLFTWTVWLRLRHPALRYIIAISLMGGIAIALLICALPAGINFAGDRGVATQVNGLLQMLAPFFVGALAAISAFDRKSLDEPMGGNAPYYVRNGENFSPTRRQFFGYLFGYLAAVSVIMYGVSAIILIVGASSPDIKAIFSPLHHGIAAFLTMVPYFVAIVNLGLTTLIGLHFLIVYLPTQPIETGFRPRQPPTAPQNTFVPDATNPKPTRPGPAQVVAG
jgi:hypothetical protein